MKRREFLFSGGLGTLGLGASVCFNTNTAHGADGKQIKPLLIETKVLVVGGGPAGIGAAIGAARAGAETLLIENYGFFGGVASWGLGMCMNQMRPNGKPRGYVHELLLEKLQNLGTQAVRLSTHQFYVNVDYLKVAVLDALDEAGCKYLVHTKAVDVLMSGNRITGVVVATKSGLAEIHADIVIDCTGDADIAYLSGAPTLKETGNLSPQTCLFNVTQTGNFTKENQKEVNQKAPSKYPLIPSGWGLRPVSNANHFYVNHGGTKDLGNFDITDPFQFSKAECLSRRQVVQMVQAMREFGGTGNDIELVGTSPQIGVRESRRVKGAYVLTEEDALQGKKFDDAIAWRSGFMDIGFVRVTPMKIHQVPYRSIVPEKVDGLLMAGRCISATHEGASAGKSMGNCFATGHAAGVAASICSKENKFPREIDVKKVQAILTQDGVDLTQGGQDQDRKMDM
jgi:hypothetical protein